MGASGITLRVEAKEMSIAPSTRDRSILVKHTAFHKHKPTMKTQI